jgi:hypothetical protein
MRLVRTEMLDSAKVFVLKVILFLIEKVTLSSLTYKLQIIQMYKLQNER